MKIYKAALFLLAALSASEARAGGFLGDAVRITQPANAALSDQLDRSRNALGAAVANQSTTSTAVGVAGGKSNKYSINPSLLTESNCCLTAIGECTVPTKALKGSSCYCDTGSGVKFGTIQ
jgi:hypothetical protein